MNSGESNNFFRESFRGFNKDDVAEYIAKLSKDYTVNEEKYKEHIAKLNAELKTKNEEIANFASDREKQIVPLNEIEQKYKEEVSRLVNELNQKDTKLKSIQVQADLNRIEVEELAEQKETIDNLTEELEDLREKYEALEAEAAALRGSVNEPKIDSDAINQITFQLAESESERMFLFNLLKKFISVLDIENMSGKDIAGVANISDMAPKSEIAGKIEKGLGVLAGFKEKAAELETENTALKEELEKNQVARADEQKMYESVTADLGGIIYSAKKSAEEISAKAKADAENIVGEAKIEAEYIIEDANSKKEAIFDENRKNIAKMREKYEFIKKEHENMYQKYKEISENYAGGLSKIEDTINSICVAVNADANANG